MAGETVITVVGNLTNDPEIRFTASGAAVTLVTTELADTLHVAPSLLGSCLQGRDRITADCLPGTASHRIGGGTPVAHR